MAKLAMKTHFLTQLKTLLYRRINILSKTFKMTQNVQENILTR